MADQSKSRTQDWLIFFVSTAVMLLLLVVIPEWFWVALPFSLTYFVKALDWI